MRIAFDLDDVLAEFQVQWIAFNNNKYNTNLTLSDLYTYDYTKTMNISMDEMVKRFREIYVSEYMDMIQPDVEAARVVEELVRKGHQLSIITSRDLLVAEKTKNWIGEYFPNTFQEIILTGEVNLNQSAKKVTKGDICQQKQIDILIDDAPMYVEQVLDKNIRAIMPNKPWNLDFTVNTELFNRIDQLSEISALIGKMS